MLSSDYVLGDYRTGQCGYSRGVELSLQLQEEGMVSLTVRSIYPDSFGVLAGSCVQAADPSRTLEDTVNEAGGKSRYGPAKSR